ncbi:hypothetical protein [Halalkalibacter oceani]|uniref:hypothetical protein n=1 Tax=Halalkalibacter oceani TaxID=1653776 RepID=UPI003393E9C2
MKLTEEQLKIGEWYYEFEDETGAYHIYHTESGHSPYSYASSEEAERKVNLLNSFK